MPGFPTRAPRRHARRLVPVLLVLLGASAGCFQARYLTQAARGQLALRRAARPIAEVIADPTVPPRVRALLREVAPIKAFGERHGLTPARNYEDYAALDREAVAWVVTACRPLAFEEKLWRFPVVGSVPYLGFFRERSAHDYARALEREGWDVDVRGVETYSTLGWFKDPIASPMVGAGDDALGELADVVLHESVHATLYLDDQTTFNESLASFVAPRLAAEWLAGARGEDAPETVAWRARRARARQVDAVLHDAWRELDETYRADLPDAEKRLRKTAVLDRVEEATGIAVNNATLVDARTYGAGLPELEALFERCGGDWGRFWEAVRTLDTSSFPSPQTEDLAGVLGPLADRCAAPPARAPRRGARPRTYRVARGRGGRDAGRSLGA